MSGSTSAWERNATTLVVVDLLDGLLAPEHRAAGLEVRVPFDRPLEPGREPRCLGDIAAM
jgi:hypothetical protein